MIIKNKNTIHRSSAAIIGDVAAKLGCDISGSTDDVDLCMVTHCRNPIGYAVLCGNQWSRISEQEFNKFSKPSKHVYIESIDVSLDPDTARLPGYRKRLGCVPGAVPAAGAVPEERHAADAVRPVHYRTAALYSVPAVWRQHCRRTYRDSDRLPVSGSAGTPAYLRRSGEMERQALDGYCTSQLAAAP